jgi:hypothetical protein
MTVQTSDTASCAVVIEVAGTQYIGGRQSESALPVIGQPFGAKRWDCDDSGGGHTGTTPIVATSIRGVPVVDAVAAQGYQLMLSERLWSVAWIDLPSGLRSYVARDSAKVPSRASLPAYWAPHRRDAYARVQNASPLDAHRPSLRTNDK